MNKKSLTLLSLSIFFFVIIIVFYSINDQDLADHSMKDDWETFEKIEKGKIESHPTTEAEKKVARILANQDHNQKKRIPSSYSNLAKMNNNNQDDRAIINNGQTSKKYRVRSKSSPDWKKKFAHTITRFLKEKSKVLIKPQKSVTLVTNGEGHEAEQVLVKIITPDGKHYAYNALVDGKTGTTIKTWNKTIHEPLKGDKRDRPTFKVNL